MVLVERAVLCVPAGASPLAGVGSWARTVSVSVQFRQSVLVGRGRLHFPQKLNLDFALQDATMENAYFSKFHCYQSFATFSLALLSPSLKHGCWPLQGFRRSLLLCHSSSSSSSHFLNPFVIFFSPYSCLYSPA